MTISDRFFLVENDRLGEYGHEDGMTKEELMRALDEVGDGVVVTVIQGRVVPTRQILREKA